MRINKMMFLKPYNKEDGWVNTNLDSNGYDYKITARYLNNKYVSGYFTPGTETGISVSDDGLTWTNTALNYNDPTNGDISPYIADIAYGNSKYVAVSGFVYAAQAYSIFGGGYTESRIRTSSSGGTWSITGSDYAAEGLIFTGLAFGNSKFIATLSSGGNLNSLIGNSGGFTPAGSKVIVSTDGDNWTELTVTNLPVIGITTATDPETFLETNTYSIITDIKFFNNKFVIIGSEYTDYNFTRFFSYTSTDGVTWVDNTDLNIPTGNKMVIGNNLLVCIGTAAGNSTVHTSSDGITWTATTINNLYITSENMTYGAGKYVLSIEYRIYTSTDLQNWDVTATLNWSNSLLYANNKFFCYAGIRVDFSSNYTSLDGLSWKYESVPWSLNNYSNYEASEGFVTNYARYSMSGYISAFTTDKGNTWFASKRFARNGKIIKSGNFFYSILSQHNSQASGLYKEVGLDNWVLVAALPTEFNSEYVYDFSYNGTTIIVKRNDNSFYYTSDNTTWTQKTFSGVDSSSSVSGPSWFNSKFIVFINGHCHSTVDGITWTDEGISQYQNSGYNQFLILDNSKLLNLIQTANNYQLWGSADGVIFNLMHEFTGTDSYYNSTQVLFSEGKYLVYLNGYNSGTVSRLFISTDGSNWIDISSKLFQNNQEYVLSSIGGSLLISGSYSVLYIRKI